MQNKEKQIYVLIVVLIITLLFVFQVLLVHKGFFAISADEAGHTLEGYYWYKGTSSFFSIWLPFQKILYGLGFQIWSNLFWTPRIISSLFGLLTLLSLMNLTFQLFQDYIIVSLTGFLSAIFWGLDVFSVLPMQEIYFTFFVVTSIALLIKWERDNNIFYLILAIIFASIGNTVRFEAWVFSFVIYLVIIFNIYHKPNRTKFKIFPIIGLSLVLFFFPLIWMLLSYHYTGKFTSFVSVVSSGSPVQDTIGKLKNNVIYSFFRMNIVTLNIIGLFSIIYLRKKPFIRDYVIILITTLLIFGTISFISNTLPSHNTWRLTTIWSVLLLPLTAFILKQIFYAKIKFNLTFSSITFALLIYLFLRQTSVLTTVSFISKEDLVIGNYIREEIFSNDSNTNIFIQENNWLYTSLLITSQNPDRFIKESVFSKDITYNSLPLYDGIINELKKHKIEFVILKPYNTDYFNLSDLIVIKEFNNWIIYKLK